MAKIKIKRRGRRSSWTPRDARKHVTKIERAHRRDERVDDPVSARFASWREFARRCQNQRVDLSLESLASLELTEQTHLPSYLRDALIAVCFAGHAQSDSALHRKWQEFATFVMAADGGPTRHAGVSSLPAEGWIVFYDIWSRNFSDAGLNPELVSLALALHFEAILRLPLIRSHDLFERAERAIGYCEQMIEMIPSDMRDNRRIGARWSEGSSLWLEEAPRDDPRTLMIATELSVRALAAGVAPDWERGR